MNPDTGPTPEYTDAADAARTARERRLDSDASPYDVIAVCRSTLNEYSKVDISSSGDESEENKSMKIKAAVADSRAQEDDQEDDDDDPSDYVPSVGEDITERESPNTILGPSMDSVSSTCSDYWVVNRQRFAERPPSTLSQSGAMPQSRNAF